MPVLVVRTAALRHNLAVMNERCVHAGTTCMFVFKEAPLHPQLTEKIMKGIEGRRLGLVAWPYDAAPVLPGVEIHHVYAPSLLMTHAAAACRCVYIDSLFTLRALASACREHRPELRFSLEVGDGRDGALPDEMPELCEEARRLGFFLRGLSINFACLSTEAPTKEVLGSAATALDGIRSFCLPDADVSAGGTDVLEFAEHCSLPSAVGEIRCGTGVTLGMYPLTGRAVPDARQDAFRLEAHVLECRVKKGRITALLDMGTFHTDPKGLKPPFPGMTLNGASSAYAAFDVTDCPELLREGMRLSFGLDYHALSRALSSRGLPVVEEDR